MKIPVNFGGGSSGSDDVTAKAAQVLSPYTAITAESEDEPAFGTMQDYAGTTQSATSSLDTSNQRLQLTIPNEGRYTTASKIYQTYANIRSLIGYTDASKVLSGTTYLGLAGTMADRSGTTSSATSSLDSSNSRVRLQIPSNGYYNTSAYLYNTYSNIASLIGLTAAKIKYGESILGITGTWNGYVATSSDLYYGGSIGSLAGSVTVLSPTTGSGSATLDTDCIVMSKYASGNTGVFGFTFTNGINLAAYSTITLTFTMVSPPSASTSSSNVANMWLGIYSSRPSSNSDLAESASLTYTERELRGTSANSTYTITLSVSNISQTAYVGAGATGSANTASYFTLNVTRVQLS